MHGNIQGAIRSTQQAPAADDQELQGVALQLVEVLQAVLAHYRLSQEESIHAIRSLRSIVHGFVSLEAAGGFGMPIDLDASFDWLIALFIAGL